MRRPFHCVVLLLCFPGCVSRERRLFDDAFNMMEGMAVGTELPVFERAFSLPPPTKTLAGSSLYEHRIFIYHRADGLRLDLGLREENGRFFYAGDHQVAVGPWFWRRWLWADADAVWEYRGLAKERTNPSAGGSRTRR